MNLFGLNLQPMNFLRPLAADLRERQVLPAVVLLAVLAIGIPLYASIELAKSPAPVTINPAPVDATPPAGAPAPGQALLTVETPQPQGYTVYKGQEPNPFRTATSPATSSSKSSPAVTTPAKTTTPTTVVPAVTPKSTAPKPKATAPKTKSTAPKSESAPAKLSDDESYAINAVTSYGSQTDTLDDVERLTPLPANVDGEIVYLGVTHHGEKAVFLLTQAVAAKLTASSSVKCLPSQSACQVIELEPGQHFELTPTGGNGSLAAFTFKLSSIKASTYGSSSAAKSARTSVSVAGQLIVAQSTSTVLPSFVYDAGTGALLYKPGTTSGATGATGTTG